MSCRCWLRKQIGHVQRTSTCCSAFVAHRFGGERRLSNMRRGLRRALHAFGEHLQTMARTQQRRFDVWAAYANGVAKGANDDGDAADQSQVGAEEFEERPRYQVAHKSPGLAAAGQRARLWIMCHQVQHAQEEDVRDFDGDYARPGQPDVDSQARERNQDACDHDHHGQHGSANLSKELPDRI